MENPALHMIDKVIRDLQSAKTWIHKDDLNKIESALKLQELVKEKSRDTRLVNTAFVLQSLIDESEK